MTASRRLFVFVDRSESSLRAWRWSLENTIRKGDHVTLVSAALHDLPASGIAAFGGLRRVSPDSCSGEMAPAHQVRQRALSKTKELLQEYLKEATPNEWKLDTRVVCLRGRSVGVALVDFLQRHRADEVILGARQMSLLKRTMFALIGSASVSEYVVKHAPCSVVLIRDALPQRTIVS